MYAVRRVGEMVLENWGTGVGPETVRHIQIHIRRDVGKLRSFIVCRTSFSPSLMAAAAASPDPSIAALSLGGSTVVAAPTPTASDGAEFRFPSYASFPPFYTLQPNLTTRARQLELWSSLVTSYCAHHRLFRLAISSPPPDLFANTALPRSLKPADVRAVLDYMSQPANGPRAEWIAPTARGETSSVCYIYWKTPAEWADLLYAFVEDTGQKGAVLTIYELREGDASRGKEWSDIDEAVLRKALNVLAKRGKAQIFGQEDSAGVKFF
ncbi:Vacuolar protein-sorting-associated protein 25 [Cercospora beticola]|uniref:ESCRT-II complex subunit VPS25 n=2 Tax=Cercospora beticola TaxID=122368 RepID=A0A2G5I8R9_CERBT|nr:Vacuolar protein-sorting-associated protein 25 [Cercospora beticola]PIB01170.1 Vacuolar protein-sorting-associated protein 25 [Cercospora beticola]